jgi:hypothetical protein
MELCVGEASKNGKTMGGAANVCDRVEIDPSTKIARLQNVIHHEMRHMRQHYLAVNYDPQAYINAVCNRVLKNHQLSKKELNVVLEDSLNRIKESFNLRNFSEDNVPVELREYAQKCIDASRNYVNGHENYDKYWNSFVEVDARHAGSEIDKLFYGKVDKT